jgi:hypothetical protein
MGQKHGKMTSKTQQMFFLIRGALKKTKSTHVHVQTPSKKHPPTSFFCVCFFSTCFFYCIFRRFSASGVQKNQKGFFMSKMFYKTNEKNCMSCFPLISFVAFFGRFSAWGVQKKLSKKSPDISKKAPTHLRAPNKKYHHIAQQVIVIGNIII